MRVNSLGEQNLPGVISGIKEYYVSLESGTIDMKPFGLAKQFEAYEQMSDIPARAKRTEMIQWIGMLFGSVLFLISADMMLRSGQDLFGLSGLLVTFIFIVYVKLWAHIRIVTYQIIKEIQLQKEKS